MRLDADACPFIDSMVHECEFASVERWLHGVAQDEPRATCSTSTHAIKRLSRFFFNAGAAFLVVRIGLAAHGACMPLESVRRSRVLFFKRFDWMGSNT